MERRFHWFLHVFVHMSKLILVPINVEADCWVNVQQHRLSVSTLLPPQPGVWGGSTQWAFSGFQISVSDYPAISSLCLFDFLYRLKAIPNQTSFIDETTQPPSPWINTTRILVCALLGATTSICWRKVHISSGLHEHTFVETCGGIIFDSTASKGMWLDATLLALPSFTYNIYPIDFFWLKI